MPLKTHKVDLRSTVYIDNCHSPSQIEPAKHMNVPLNYYGSTKLIFQICWINPNLIANLKTPSMLFGGQVVVYSNLTRILIAKLSEPSQNCDHKTVKL